VKECVGSTANDEQQAIADEAKATLWFDDFPDFFVMIAG
jgi:hypothetical protein